jgi:hypothetical protein
MQCVFKQCNVNMCTKKHFLLKLRGKCFRINSIHPTNTMHIVFLRYLCNNTLLLHVSVHGGSSWSGHQVSNILQRLSTFYSVTFLHHTPRCDFLQIVKFRNWWQLRRGFENCNLEEIGAQWKWKLVEWLLVYWGIMVF